MIRFEIMKEKKKTFSVHWERKKMKKRKKRQRKNSQIASCLDSESERAAKQICSVSELIKFLFKSVYEHRAIFKLFFPLILWCQIYLLFFFNLKVLRKIICRHNLNGTRKFTTSQQTRSAEHYSCSEFKPCRWLSSSLG